MQCEVAEYHALHILSNATQEPSFSVVGTVEACQDTMRLCVNFRGWNVCPPSTFHKHWHLGAGSDAGLYRDSSPGNSSINSYILRF
jgi:hypothetical protein